MKKEISNKDLKTLKKIYDYLDMAIIYFDDIKDINPYRKIISDIEKCIEEVESIIS